VFGCNLVGEEGERVQTRMSRLGGCLAWGGDTLTPTPRLWCRSGRRNISPAAELYPLTAQIKAAAICDYILFDLVQRLADRSMLNAILTRKVAFWGRGWRRPYLRARFKDRRV